MDLPILSMSQKWNHMLCGLLSLASLIWHHVFKGYLYCSMYPHFIPFFGWIIILRGIHPFMNWSVFGWFLLFGYCEQCCFGHLCMSFCVDICFISLAHLGVELPSHMISLCLTFWGVGRLFSTATSLFYIPMNNVWVPASQYPCQHLSLFVFLFWFRRDSSEWWLELRS